MAAGFTASTGSGLGRLRLPGGLPRLRGVVGVMRVSDMWAYLGQDVVV
jgi:hypothetical protein